MAFMTPSALDECDTELEDLRRLSAVVIALQRQAETQGPKSAPSAGKTPKVSKRRRVWNLQLPRPALARPHGSNRIHFVLLTAMLLVALGAGWSAGRYFHRAPAPAQESAQEVNIDTVVDQIIKVESNGDA